MICLKQRIIFCSKSYVSLRIHLVPLVDLTLFWGLGIEEKRQELHSHLSRKQHQTSRLMNTMVLAVINTMKRVMGQDVERQRQVLLDRHREGF